MPLPDRAPPAPSPLPPPPQFFWQEKGEAASITNAVSAIDTCLREPPGRAKCAQVQGEFGDAPSSGGFGKAFGK